MGRHRSAHVPVDAPLRDFPADGSAGTGCQAGRLAGAVTSPFSARGPLLGRPLAWQYARRPHTFWGGGTERCVSRQDAGHGDCREGACAVSGLRGAGRYARARGPGTRVQLHRGQQRVTEERAKKAGGRSPQAQQEMARLLLGGRWQPITQTLTFIQGPVSDLVDSFVSWRGQGILERTSHPVRVSTVRGDLEDLLGQLLPLNVGSPRRHLFIPTSQPATGGSGPWTCVLTDMAMNHGNSNGDLNPYVFRGFPAIRVESAPSVVDPATGKGTHGIHRLGVFRPRPPLEPGRPGHKGDGRTIGIAQLTSTRRWDFVDEGKPLPFEDTDRYGARRVRDRFNQETLIEYAAALGIRPFDPNFYAPDRSAVLIENTDPPPYGSWVTDLAGNQSRPRGMLPWQPDPRRLSSQDGPSVPRSWIRAGWSRRRRPDARA